MNFQSGQALRCECGHARFTTNRIQTLRDELIAKFPQIDFNGQPIQYRWEDLIPGEKNFLKSMKISPE